MTCLQIHTQNKIHPWLLALMYFNIDHIYRARLFNTWFKTSTAIWDVYNLYTLHWTVSGNNGTFLILGFGVGLRVWNRGLSLGFGKI